MIIIIILLLYSIALLTYKNTILSKLYSPKNKHS